MGVRTPKLSKLPVYVMSTLMVLFVASTIYSKFIKSYGDTNSTGHVWPASPIFTSPPSNGHMVPCTAAKHETRVFVFAPSAIKSHKRRERLRKSWAKALPIVRQRCPLVTWEFAFILGEASSTEEQTQLSLEEADFGDILLAGVKDNDRGEAREVSATTEKTLFALRFAARNNFDYVVRGADDAYINFVNLANAMVNMPRERLFWGRFVYDRKMNHMKVRNFLRSHYLPPFTLGMGWVLSGDLARWINNSEIPFLPAYPEDGMLGLWFGGLDILRYDDPRFHHVPGSNPPEKWAVGKCDGTEIVSHYLKPHHFEQIDDEGNLKC